MRASNSQPTKGFQTDGSAVTVAVQGERSCTWGRGHARAVGSIRYPMDRMTKDIRALELYRMARSVVDTQGRFVSVGVLTFKEYRLDDLSIRFWPSTDHLEIWHKRKALVVNRAYGQLAVRHYVPGEWEEVLEDVAARFVRW